MRAGWRALDRHTERLRQTRERALASTQKRLGPSMSIAVQPKAPLLLGPGPGQRTGQRREGEISRHNVEQRRHDPGREEGERCQQTDVPLGPAFPTGDYGETG